MHVPTWMNLKVILLLVRSYVVDYIASDSIYLKQKRQVEIGSTQEEEILSKYWEYF